jgi:VWFA-related protein
MLSLSAGQTPFRVDVKLIDVSVSVRDGEGRLVTDLGQDDFDISEDGASQKIAFFARSQDVPLNLGFIVDFSGSQGPFIKPHHKDLEAFLGSVLGPADRVFLLCFGNYLRLTNEFTSSPKELLAGLQAYEKGNRGFPELGPIEDRSAGTAFYDAIYYSATEMLAKAEHGRRALIVPISTPAGRTWLPNSNRSANSCGRLTNWHTTPATRQTTARSARFPSR